MKRHVVRASILVILVVILCGGYYGWKCIRVYEAKCILSNILNEKNTENISLTIKRIPFGVLRSTAYSLDEMIESDSSDGIEVNYDKCLVDAIKPYVSQ